MNKFNLALSYALAVALVSNEAEAMTLRPTMESPAIALPEFAQQFVADGNHTCDFAHRRMNDQQQVNVDSIVGSGTTFTDSTFPTGDAIDWDDHTTTFRSLDHIADSSYLQWSRMGQTYPTTSGYSLFGSGVKPSDVEQGSIGNCWFLAAAASVAEVPNRLEDHWITKEMNAEGIYALNMYILGVPITVVVDDYVPHYGSTYYTVFAKVQRSGDKTTWMTILEKAYAKLMGNYAQLVGGWAKRGVETLTGYPSQEITNASKTEAQLWEFLDSADNSNDIITAGTHYNAAGDSSTNADGIAYSHAYSVIGTETITDLSGNTHKLFRVRNPWKSEGYTGDFSDADEVWNNVSPATKTAIGYTNSLQDGFFFMSIESFKRNFRACTMNKDMTGWHHSHFLVIDDETTSATSPGSLYYCGSSCSNHDFTVRSNVAQTVHVTAYLHDERSYPTDCSFKTNYSAAWYNFSGSNRQTGWSEGSLYIGEYSLSAGTDYNLQLEFPWEAVPDMSKNFSVVVWGNQSEVSITHDRGLTSDQWPLQAAEESQPNPNPNPTPSPVFSDSQAAFQAMVDASSFSSQYDQTAYTCATEFVGGVVDGHEALIVSSDCADSVEVSVTLAGNFTTTQHLASSGATCQAGTSALSCLLTVSSSGSMGILTQSTHDISASGYSYTVQHLDASGSSVGASVSGNQNTTLVNGPAVAQNSGDDNMIFLRLSDLSSEFDAWTQITPAVDIQYDSTTTLCGAQIWQSIPFDTVFNQEAFFIGTDCADHYFRVQLSIPMPATTQYLEATPNFGDCSYASGVLTCDMFLFQGAGANAFGILTQHGFDLHGSGWSYTYQVFTLNTNLEVLSGQGDDMDLFISLPIPQTQEEILREDLDTWVSGLTVTSFDASQFGNCGGQFFESILDGRPVIGFAHVCDHPVEVILTINSGAFGAADEDIVVGSNHLEESCQSVGGDRHECTITVEPSVAGSVTAFGIMLNDGYNGHYSSAFNY